MKKNSIQIALSILVLWAASAYILWQYTPPFFFYEYEWKAASGMGRLVSSPILLTVTGSTLVMLATLVLYRLSTRLLKNVGIIVRLLVSWVLPFVISLCSCGIFESNDSQRNFESLMVLAGREDWMAVGRWNQKHPATTHQEQNIVYLAYAQLGILPDHFRRQRQPNVEDLFVLEIPNPYVAAMLSDVYWHMGEISMSQMYAFEANEKMSNASPRLLRRLVQTNIIAGYYAVAEKYLSLLVRLGCDDAFVSHYRTLLSDEAVAADPLMNSKRLCVPEENGFPSARSIPYDLQRILIQNPQHSVSLQYLKAIQML